MKEKITEKELRKLITKYVDGSASKEEVEFLNLYYGEIEKKPGIVEHMSDSELFDLYEKISAGVAGKIYDAEVKKGKVRYMRPILRAAAVLVGVVLAAAFWYLNSENQKNSQPKEKQLASQAIAPGGNKAILTLADGKQIILDSLNNGDVSRQGNVTIIKLDDGQLAYKGKTDASSGEILYNTITTPRGGQYKVILADGSVVWLNAESSLTYPTAFAGKERKVEMKGEGYFEVAKNKEMPFVVQVGEMQVEVSGTEFNVNAYEDEGVIRTTLLEGGVKISTQYEEVKLLPGEQINFKNGSKKLEKFKNVDIDQVVAWKNGYFSFENASLKDVMRQISRWYDVEVEYEGTVEYRNFGGGVSRKSQLNEVLKILEESNVRFTMKGKTITVKP